MPATMRDIAKKLNISVSTVSYALNGGPRPVTEELRQRVLNAAEELKFTPNRLARNLSIGQTHTLGYVAWKPGPDSLLSPHATQVLNGMLNACDEMGYDFLIFAHHGDESRREFTRSLTDRRVDGIVINGDSQLTEVRKAVREAGLPMIVLGGTGSEADESLRIDNSGGIMLAVEHLYNLGHTDIGFMGGLRGIVDADEREAGFRAAMAALGLPCREEWMVETGFMIATTEAQVSRLMQKTRRPSALVCVSDEVAIGAIRGASAAGLLVPRDLSVVGFDDIPFAWLAVPSLTTVRKPTSEVGYFGAKLLVARLKGEHAPVPPPFPTELVSRKSTRRVPVKVEA